MLLQVNSGFPSIRAQRDLKTMKRHVHVFDDAAPFADSAYLSRFSASASDPAQFQNDVLPLRVVQFALNDVAVLFAERTTEKGEFIRHDGIQIHLLGGSLNVFG